MSRFAMIVVSIIALLFAVSGAIIAQRKRATTQHNVALVRVLPNGDVAPVVAQAQQPLVAEAATQQFAPLGELRGDPSVTPEQIDTILAERNSPAVQTGSAWYTAGVRYGIDPAYAVAFFVIESSAGTNPAWAGIKGDGSYTHNVGNIICAGYATCYGRFRDYPTWTDGIEDWFRLIADEYVAQGLTNVATIIPVYAPSIENDVAAYVASVNDLVAEWRATSNTQVQQIAYAVGASAMHAPPLALTGCLGTNVRAAMEASPNLHSITIPAGGDWSFNENWVIAGVVMCGVVGGGVCNQASRYSYVARNLGLQVGSQYHGYIYDSAVPQEDNLAIWSSGSRGGQDLIIHNPTNQTVHIEASIEGNTLYVQGWLE